MRCALCGVQLDNSLRLYCDTCTAMTTRWWGWAVHQQRRTGRWPKLEVTFDQQGPHIRLDRSGGHPDTNKFQGEPPKLLGSPGAVLIQVPQDRSVHEGGIGAGSSNADLAFYLRLKATPGCTSKLVGNTMNLYIEPNSEAARLFVQRMMAKHRALPASGGEAPRQLVEQCHKLLPGGLE